MTEEVTELPMLTLEDIQNTDDLPTKLIPVPAWGGQLKIRMLTKSEQQLARNNAIADGVLDEMKLELGIVAIAIVEPNLSLEHIQILCNKNADVVDEILAEVFMLSAIDKKAVSRARDEFQEGLREVDGVSPGGEAAHDSATNAPGDDNPGVHGVAGVPAE